MITIVERAGSGFARSMPPGFRTNKAFSSRVFLQYDEIFLMWNNRDVPGILPMVFNYTPPPLLTDPPKPEILLKSCHTLYPEKL